MKNWELWVRNLSIVAFLALSAFALWFGGLNQDEGWYLYAAKLVSEGRMPYRDFAFTQGPVLPYFYSFFTSLYYPFGLLGGRIFTLVLGSLSILCCLGVAKKLGGSLLICFLLLACNLYHLYYLSIPKTYALTALFLSAGVWMFLIDRWWSIALAAALLSLATGTRISFGLTLAVCGCYLLYRREWLKAVIFALVGFAVLALIFGPFLIDPQAREGLIAAQSYHALRSGGGLMMVAGSLSRLSRYYALTFLLLAFTLATPAGRVCHSVTAVIVAPVFLFQLFAPCPYEDYQVPLMGLLAAVASCAQFSSLPTFLLAGLLAFSNPLIEKWMSNGQDRFWPIMKVQSELSQLRSVAREINALDPGGSLLLTQDTYLAVETNRHVPTGLEMGPFSILSSDEWRALLEITPCNVAALSGYTFAVNPPKCDKRPLDEQLEFWQILKKRYDLKDQIDYFGQQATTLLILKQKEVK